MDTNTTIIIVVLILAAVAVIGLLLFRSQGKASLKGPWNTGVDVSGSNDPSPAAQITNSESSEGGALAEDGTGRGARIDQTNVKDDLIATSNPSNQDNAPKA